MTEQKLKILVVDDEASVGQVVKAGLERHGFTVKYEACSTDTIKACLDFHPDLVLLDIDMPVKDGGQVAAELQSHPTLGRTPVVFLTSLASKRRSGKRSAAGEVLMSKELSIAELAGGIRAILHPQTLH